MDNLIKDEVDLSIRDREIVRMNWYGNVSPKQRRIYNTLIGVIALTLPCYCLGLLALILAPSIHAGGNPSTSSPALPTPTAIAIVTLPLAETPGPTPTEWQPHTITPTPSASATNTSTPTPTASATPTIAILTVTATPVPSPTLKPTNTVEPAATPQGETYTLRLVKRDEDSLFVINDSRKAFPLKPLRLGEGSDALNGQEWDLDNLKLGECVTVWKNGSKPQPPAVKCKQVGKRLTRSGAHRFWLTAFNVYYQEKQVGTCTDTVCTVTINPS